MFIDRTKYRKLRTRVSYLPYYWDLYKKRYPTNSSKVFEELNLALFFYEYERIKRYKRIPFVRKIYIRVYDYEMLTRYAKVSKKLKTSHKRNKPIRIKNK